MPEPQKDHAPEPADTADHQRAAARRRVLKSGLICFNGRHSTLPCVVRDFSETGARLSASGSIGIPDTFELHVELDGIWVACEVIWRRQETVGVRFTSQIKVEPPKRRQTLVLSAASGATKPSLRRQR